jgi:hypothetical protein
MATRLPPPARFAGALRYEHTDIPEELTLAEWRTRRHRVLRSRGPLGRLLLRLLGHR